MTIARWTPPVAPTRQEQFLLKRLDRVRKLLGFLRLHRHELFDGMSSPQPVFGRHREFEADRLWDEADTAEDLVRLLVEYPGLRFDIGDSECLCLGDCFEDECSANASSTESWINRDLVDLQPPPLLTKRIAGAMTDDNQNVPDGKAVLLSDPCASPRTLQYRFVPGCQV
jgi:hypothetical protein